jgi:hypothetical protein
LDRALTARACFPAVALAFRSSSSSVEKAARVLRFSRSSPDPWRSRLCWSAQAPTAARQAQRVARAAAGATEVAFASRLECLLKWLFLRVALLFTGERTKQCCCHSLELVVSLQHDREKANTHAHSTRVRLQIVFAQFSTSRDRCDLTTAASDRRSDRHRRVHCGERSHRRRRAADRARTPTASPPARHAG